MRLLASMALLACGLAQAGPVGLGTRTLEIPAPDGFVPVGAEAPEFLRIAEAYLPQGSRLVDMYLTPQDKATLTSGGSPELARYFQLQVARGVEGKAISVEGFAQARDEMEQGLAKAFGNAEQEAAALTDRGNRNLQETAGVDAQVAFQDVAYQGPFRREPWGLFFTVGSRISDAGNPQGSRVVSASALMLANHQILNLSAYANDVDAQSRPWAESAVVAWAEAVRAANPDDPEVARTAVDLDGHTTVFKYAAMAGGALIGVVVALVLLSLRRKKHS